MTAQQKRRLRLSRDTIIFLIGVAGIIHETVIAGGERPSLIIFFGACLGLPAFLRSDSRTSPADERPPEVLPPSPTQNP